MLETLVRINQIRKQAIRDFFNITGTILAGVGVLTPFLGPFIIPLMNVETPDMLFGRCLFAGVLYRVVGVYIRPATYDDPSDRPRYIGWAALMAVLLATGILLDASAPPA